MGFYFDTERTLPLSDALPSSLIRLIEGVQLLENRLLHFLALWLLLASSTTLLKVDVAAFQKGLTNWAIDTRILYGPDYADYVAVSLLFIIGNHRCRSYMRITKFCVKPSIS